MIYMGDQQSIPFASIVVDVSALMSRQLPSSSISSVAG
jgi:hypothetical protein